MKDQTGFSLVETIIASGIAVFIILAVTSIFTTQLNQIKGLNQKQEMLELKSLMLEQLSKPGVCSWQLHDKVIDVSGSTTESSPSPTILNLVSLHQGTSTTSALIARSSQRLPNTQHGIVVRNVTFRGIYATGNPDEYVGRFEVAFDQSSLAHNMKPVQVQQLILTNPSDPVGAKRITTCRGSVEVRAECATAYYRGKASSLPRTAVIAHTFASGSPTFNDVFETHEYTGGGNHWGLSCKAPYAGTNCGHKELGIDESAGPGRLMTSDIWLEKDGVQGCFTDDEELNGPDPVMFLTCCRYSI